MKRGNIDAQKSKLGYYLIQMPSDKISALCVMHIMKHLFSQFARDASRLEEMEEFSLLKT